MYKWGSDEILDKCVVNIMERKITIYSDCGTTVDVACETPEQFMKILEYVRQQLKDERLKYVEI